MLEPLLNLCCLLALLALAHRRGTTAGLLVAAALCFKLFAVTALLALCVSVCREPTLRRRFGVGVLAGLAAIAGPFIAFAPAAMWHDVVVVQATRPPAGLTGTTHRMTGLVSASGHVSTMWLLAFFAVVVVGLVLTSARDRRAWPWLVMLSTTVLAFLGGASFFVHYSGYVAVPIALLTAVAVSRPWLGRRLLVAACTCTCVLLVGGDVAATPRAGSSLVRASSLPSGCTWSENPSVLVSLGRLRPPTAGCPQPVDPRGRALAVAGGFPHDIRDQLVYAKVIILAGALNKDPMLDQANQTFVRTHFVQLALPGPGSVWVRSG
jgi:hypothetical protein